VFVERLRDLQRRIGAAVAAGRPDAAGGAASDVAREDPGDGPHSGDTIYRIDVKAEAALLEWAADWSRELGPGGRPFVLVAEGLPADGRMSFPAGADPADAAFECIVDPVDGTRCLMYDKRSAWALGAIAPGRAALGRDPAMSDLAVAVQTELPTSRARLVDTLWAVAGGGAAGETLDLVTGRTVPRRPSPSRATTLAHGFATIAKFFPGTKEATVWIEERLFAEVVGESGGGAPLVFDDEYVASGGQLYELLAGHDRFTADLRPALLRLAEQIALRAAPNGGAAPPRRRLCARPYDLCTSLIAVEAGVPVTDEWGRPLSAPLDTVSDVAWVGYANEHLRRRIEPVLQRLLRELGVPDAPDAL
jgi:hypothetical protein